MELQLAVLAAWLHDIGKFAQRARAYSLSRASRSDHTYAHEEYTEGFIEKILQPCMPDELKPQCSLLAGLAGRHHAPNDTPEAQAIHKADGLSAGLDRSTGDAEGDFMSARLESIFRDVCLDESNRFEAVNLRYALAPMNGPEAIFPVADTENERKSYSALFAGFCEKLQDLPRDLDMRAWTASLISLLERYTWCIPSATYGTRADISLFDHAATTAAITQAILKGENDRFLLFGGDLSGIQEFIFGKEEPADHGANKLLRARSFLLQAITRSVWLVALERLGLEHAAKIMDAGGRFVLLLPDTQETKELLADLALEVEQWLLVQFGGAVRLNLASLPITDKDLQRDRFSERFDSFNDALELAKLKPFAAAFAKGASPVLGADSSAYAEHGECAWCHARPGVREEDGRPICRLCATLLRVGAQLPTAKYVVYGRDTGIEGAQLLFDGLKLGLYNKRPAARVTCKAMDVLSLRDDLFCTVAPLAGHLPMIGEDDLAAWQKQGRVSERDGGRYFGDDAISVVEPQTFSMLAADARMPPREPGQPWRAIPCLAVCKADVDNLGLIFGRGFGDNFTLSRFAMLSRMLNHFFAAFLMGKIREKYPNIYVIFAGGDDLFVIGPWWQVIEFAADMRKWFADFCGHNPQVTISAGLPLIKSGLPMRAMREEAEDALEEAKRHPDKNAATLFGVSAAWPDFDRHLENGRWLEELCLQGTISQGFLRRLLGYSRECRAFVRGQLARDGMYISHFSYDLGRNWSKDKNQADRQRLQELVGKPELFETAEMGISWALYRTRTS